MKKHILSLTVLFVFIIIFSCKKDKTPEETPNSNPSCEIISPIEGQEFRKGETVLISVDAEDNDGSITEVRFYVDDIGVNSVSSFPYNYTWITTEQSIGSHRIKATSYDNSGNKKTDEISINILEPETIPIADFSADPVTGTEPLLVNFTDLSDHGPTSWLWNFGDGDTSTLQNPSHLYGNIGYFTVSLRVENGAGFDTITKTDYIDAGDPCSGTPTVTDADGNVYNTVRIGFQCWMKENLNVGTRINAAEDMQPNNGIEKYCQYDDEEYCDLLGGLYQWDEIMQYSTQEGAQGICPNGWHIPSDDEWKTMEMALGMTQSEADNLGWRGTDQGEQMKSTTMWDSNGNGTNTSGFTALPGGIRPSYGTFEMLGSSGLWWSSSDNSSSNAWGRILDATNTQVHRGEYVKANGVSVRCLKN